jgi:hypothetical protein
MIPSGAKTIGIITAPFKQNRAGWGAGDSDLNEAITTAAQKKHPKMLPKCHSIYS